jgi:hypothetical protein
MSLSRPGTRVGGDGRLVWAPASLAAHGTPWARTTDGQGSS